MLCFHVVAVLAGHNIKFMCGSLIVLNQKYIKFVGSSIVLIFKQNIHSAQYYHVTFMTLAIVKNSCSNC